MSLSSNFPAIKPSLLLDFANTKQLDPRVTFARATTATYYDGVTTAKAEENLVTNSQAFNVWGLEFISVSADSTTAPDGTTTADTITATGSNTNHSSYSPNTISVTAGLVYTFSVYAKKNGSNFVQLTWYPGQFGNAYANFDLNAGTAGTASGCTSTITNVGNGWYRCTMTATCASSGTSYAYYCIVTSATAGIFEAFAPTTQSIYLWGYQFEQRSTATAYTATTTQPITNYIPVLMTAAAGVPRFDHNPTTDESLGLLIEEQRTNILLYSNNSVLSFATDGTTTVYGQPGGTPDGTGQWAYTARQGYCYRTITTLANGEFVTLSMYVKAATNVTTADYGVFYVGAGVSYGGQLNFNTGVVTPYSGTTSYGAQFVGNGIWRVWVTTPAASGSQLITFNIPASGAYSWGYQMERNASFPTSYIPTVASTVTRNADQASMTGTNFSSWYSQFEGTLYAEAGMPPNNNGRIVQIGESNLTYLRMIGLVSDGTAANVLGAVYKDPTYINLAVTAYTKRAMLRGAVAYQNGSLAATFNGASPGISSSQTAISNSMTTIGIGQGDGGNYANTTIKKIAYYPLRVTNAQLQALTS